MIRHLFAAWTEKTYAVACSIGSYTQKSAAIHSHVDNEIGTRVGTDHAISRWPSDRAREETVHLIARVLRCVLCRLLIASIQLGRCVTYAARFQFHASARMNRAPPGARSRCRAAALEYVQVLQEATRLAQDTDGWHRHRRRDRCAGCVSEDYAFEGRKRSSSKRGSNR